MIETKPGPVCFSYEYEISGSVARICVRLLMDMKGEPASFAVIRADEGNVRLQLSARTREAFRLSLHEYLVGTENPTDALLRWMENI